MELRTDSDLEAQPGNFASRVDGGTLVVPAVLAELARAQHLYTAEALAGYVAAFPSSVAASLGWGPPAVIAAARRLSDQLTSSMPQCAGSSSRRVYGLG